MPYVKYNDPWQDADSATGGGDESTPIPAAALDHIEAGVAAAIPADIVDAKGDLIVGTAADTVARLAVGNDNEVPAASGGASSGIVWKKIGNAMVASDAAIDVSKLAPSATANDVLTTVGGVVVWQAAAGGSINAVTALPGSPTNGQEVILTDSLTAPTYRWHLRYNSGSSSSFKWEYIGGTPIYAAVDTQEATSSSTFAALATAGPSVTVPNAGDYLIAHGSTIGPKSTGAIGYHSYDIGGTGAVDGDGVSAQAGNSNQYSVARTARKTGLSAATALVSKYRTTNAADGMNFRNRWMSVHPIRIS